MKILVTGGAGYIGSVVVEECIAAGHTAVVIDNLSKGHEWMVHEAATFNHGELADTALVAELLRSHDIDAVIHMAASSLVGESMSDPSAYYQNNMVAGLSLLNAMLQAGVEKLIFSSTAAVYGEPERQPIAEDAALAPTNAYGETKLSFEKALRWFEHAYGIRYASLRYFNAAGASERCGELHDPETHLIPLVLNAVDGTAESVQIFGDDYPTPDGTCLRDYIHVTDLARAHVLALNVIETRSAIYNLGCGGGFSVRQVIEAVERVTGRTVPVETGPRRPGDPAVLIASSEKARADLGWEPQHESIDDIVASAWNWRLKHKDKGVTSQ
jgi:UDP-glucose 4-epimerase